jgi:mannose-6-phosphate isomerase-like protein (cupin superfamily)
MFRTATITAGIILFFVTPGLSQTRAPSTSSKPFIIKTKQQLADMYSELEKQGGNKTNDVVAPAGTQMRVAIFHDEKRENDNFEVHDSSDDIYYVLEGEATLMLGGTLTAATEISTGEWRSKSATGGEKVTIKKGDLIVVPRGTVHQRTVVGKGFSMILIKVFAETVKP